MDHMTFMTIFSFLVMLGMALMIMWSMSTVASTVRIAPGHDSRIRVMGSSRDVPQKYAFQSLWAEVAYRRALKELLVEQARLITQERESTQQPSTQPASGKN
jgi:hypothetical protein